MSYAIYLLCALSSLACTYCLFRHYLRTKLKLLLWSATSFTLLSFANILLFVDLVVFPTTVDLTVFRTGVTLLALVILISSLITESLR